ERIGRLLLEPDVVVGAAAQLIGLGEDLPPAGRQGSVTPQALEARDDLVEDDDRPALLSTVELRNGPYEQVLDGLQLALNRIGSGGHRPLGPPPPRQPPCPPRDQHPRPPPPLPPCAPCSPGPNDPAAPP